MTREGLREAAKINEVLDNIDDAFSEISDPDAGLCVHMDHDQAVEYLTWRRERLIAELAVLLRPPGLARRRSGLSK